MRVPWNANQAKYFPLVNIAIKVIYSNTFLRNFKKHEGMRKTMYTHTHEGMRKTMCIHSTTNKQTNCFFNNTTQNLSTIVTYIYPKRIAWRKIIIEARDEWMHSVSLVRQRIYIKKNANFLKYFWKISSEWFCQRKNM